VPTLERAWAGVRHRVGRALGPLATPRIGWFYVVRRTAAEWIATAIAARPTRVPVESVDLGGLAHRVPRIVVHAVEPARAVAAPQHAEPAGCDSRSRVLRCPWTSRAQRVLEIPGGVVFGEYGWNGIDDEHVLAGGEFALWDMPRASVRRVADHHRRGRAVVLPGRTANLLQPGFGNYAHFLLQGVPRLDLVDRAIGLDRVDRFLVPDDAPPFAREVLARFGVTADRFELVPRRVALRYTCETLVTATWLHVDEVGVSWAVDAVRRRFASELDRGPHKRWYLTRGHNWRRHVENEGAVRAMLATRGFEPLTMDGRTVAEQAALLAGAECVVGVHGASLSNLVFVPPGTPVIELMPANVRMWMFARLALGMGLPYDVVVGCEPSLPRPLHRFLIDADMRVDVDRLAARVDAALAR
jgi:capsular polysaccharide biosynthesis protein